MVAYTFPLPLNQFFEGLPITSVSFDLPEALQSSQNGAGEVLTADLGDRLWRADISLRLGGYYEIEPIKAKLQMLRYAGRSLIIHPIPIIAPAFDRDGSKLGARNVTLSAVAGNNRELTLAGLPVGYVLTPGDGLSFTYGSNPVRYAFHQIVQGGVSANGSLSVEVVPFIQPGYATGATVRLIKPVFKAVYVPGSFNAGNSGQQVTDGVKFSVLQTFR